MWRFNAEQKWFDIGGVRVGGAPGESQTLLIGTIFYKGQKILFDEEKGTFDRDGAEALIHLQEDFSKKTGLPHMLDVVGSTPEALRRFLDFAADATDAPLLIDGVSGSVRISGLRHACEVGLGDRVVYNSISPHASAAELEAVRESGIKSAVLLAFEPTAFTSKARMEVVRRLLPMAEKSGVKKPLIDVGVLDVPSLGVALRTIQNVKNEIGFPTGCGAHNAVSTWKGLRRKMGRQAVIPSLAVANAVTAAVGADFILYGPIEHADFVFPTISMVVAAYGQVLLEQGVRLSREHTLFRIA